MSGYPFIIRFLKEGFRHDDAMTAVNYFDDLLREYLSFRGFTSTLKAFEAELRSDKDKGFRADKIVDQLCAYIASYDLVSLRDTWSHLDQRVFGRLEHQFTPAVRKLESSLLKMYVINAVQTNRNDKLIDFFEKMSAELQNQPEWKEWFVLPFVKSPEENPVFGMYFTKLWQDTLLTSLQNFLSVIFQSMPLPTLLSFEEDQLKIKHLVEENQILKQKISDLQGQCKSTTIDDVAAESAVTEARELMDDFYIIAQEAPPADTQAKSFRDIIRNISSGLPASPILGRKQSNLPSATKSGVEEATAATGKLSVVRPKTKLVSPLASTGNPQQVRGSADPSLSAAKGTIVIQSKVPASKSYMEKTSRSTGDTITSARKKLEGVDPSCCVSEGSLKAPFILLSQDEYGEHQSTVTHCKFNSLGSAIASADVGGIVKIWSSSPSPQTLATVMSKSSILALDWASKLERLLILGNKSGGIRLYDTKEKRTLSEVSLAPAQQITCLTCSPMDSTFMCCAVGQTKGPSLPAGPDGAAVLTDGRVMIWDMKTMKLEKTLGISTSIAANSCVFNHNGQLLLMGAGDGKIILFDMRSHECIATWSGHQGDVHQVEFSPDETMCYSLGQDGKFIQWNVNTTGKMMSSTTLHDKAVGPYVLPEGLGSPGSVYHQVGKVFALDSEGQHVLTCAGNGGMVYSVPSCASLHPIMSLGGHRTPVTTVDWFSAMDCGMCITASLDGKIKISTLLAQ